MAAELRLPRDPTLRWVAVAGPVPPLVISSASTVGPPLMTGLEEATSESLPYFVMAVPTLAGLVAVRRFRAAEVRA